MLNERFLYRRFKEDLSHEVTCVQSLKEEKEGAKRFLREQCSKQREQKVQMAQGRRILGMVKEQQGKECGWEQ